MCGCNNKNDNIKNLNDDIFDNIILNPEQASEQSLEEQEQVPELDLEQGSHTSKSKKQNQTKKTHDRHQRNQICMDVISPQIHIKLPVTDQGQDQGQGQGQDRCQGQRYDDNLCTKLFCKYFWMVCCIITCSLMITAIVLLASNYFTIVVEIGAGTNSSIHSLVNHNITVNLLNETFRDSQ